MKKILHIFVTGLIIIIGVPILLVGGIGYLIYVPFDIIRYHKMPYYRDFKVKYKFFLTSRDVVKIYNHIVRERLQMEYFKNNNLEYFVKEGQVLLCGWGFDRFEQVDGEWYFVFAGECDNRMSMKETIENERELLNPEHRCLPVKFLFFYKDVTDAEMFEKAKECPYFYCAFSVDEIV